MHSPPSTCSQITATFQNHVRICDHNILCHQFPKINEVLCSKLQANTEVKREPDKYATL